MEILFCAIGFAAFVYLLWLIWRLDRITSSLPHIDRSIANEVDSRGTPSDISIALEPKEDDSIEGELRGFRVSDMDDFSGEPNGQQSCYDCYYCRGTISWWCKNKESIAHRGTALTGAKNCPYYLFDGDAKTYEDNRSTKS